MIDQIINIEEYNDDIQINPLNIQNAYLDQASKYASYASLELQAMRQEATAKLKRDVMMARIDKEIRDRATQNKEKITETIVDYGIKSDARYILVQSEYDDAKAIAKFASNILESFKQRRDMLIGLGATLREEAKGDLYLRSKEEERSNAIRAVGSFQNGR